ncbi:MAG: transporter substrate-binding domain-containing protein [Alphaproteobacteria bacterium]|nr:transporter substrate-binding domain-containing protein [Alphaproteobacteria bacterium]
MGNRYLAVAFAATASLLAVATPGQAQEKLMVGSECTYFPFNYRDSDNVLKGYDIDVANEIAKRLNAKVEYVCMKFDGLLPALLAGKFDLIAASLSITEDRRQKIDFSVPYRLSIGQFVAPKAKKLQLFNADGSLNKPAFKGIRVGIQRATTYDNWFQAIVPDANVVRYEGVEAIYLDLKAGRVDAIMTNPMKTYLEFLSKPDGAGFEVVGPQITEEKYFGTGAGIGLRKDNPELLKRIDTAILDMKKDGTLDKFSKLYFPFAIYPIN